MEPLPFEREQRRALRRMKRFATGLLLVMVVLYLASRSFEGLYPWLAWIRAFAEAAMVGALADWFAVTALFRHPLGLPIPHTAIIPANQERIGETMGAFVQANFLSEQTLGGRLAGVSATEYIAEWLNREENAERVSAELVRILPELLRALDDYEVRRFVYQAVSDFAEQIEAAPAAAKVLELTTAGEKYHELVDELLKLAQVLIERHQGFLRALIREEMPWYVPAFVHDKVYQTIIERIRSTLTSVNADPQHELRLRVRGAVDALIVQLRESPECRAEGERWKRWLLDVPAVRLFLTRLGDDVRELIINDCVSDHSATRRAIASALRALSAGLLREPAVRARLDETLQRIVRRLLREYGGSISTFIADTVKRWDTATIVDKVEISIGRDLQFIRVNGTIVGGIAGLAIHTLTVLLGL